MAKPNRQELVARIHQNVAELERERAGLLEQQALTGDRLRLVDGMLAQYRQLLSPKEKPQQPTVTVNVGSRTAARQERKAAMIAFLKEHGEAQTAEIIDAMKVALPHANPTRAQVQDVLQNEPEFAASKKGVWGLAPAAIPTVVAKPSTYTAKRGLARAAEQIQELLG